MKKLLVVVVLLAAVLLLAPFGIGKMAEARLNHGLDKMLEQAPYLVVSERKWTGGWFKSRQELTVELAPAFVAMMGASIDDALKHGAKPDDAEDADEDADGETDEAAAAAEAAREAAEKIRGLRLKVYNDVLHGPVLGTAGFGFARVDSTIDLPPEALEKIREVFGPKPALEMRTRIGFFGGGTTFLTSEGRKLNTADEIDVRYDTFKLAMGYDRDFNSYDLDGKLPKLEITGEGNELLFDSFTIGGDGKRVRNEIYDGDVEFRVKKISYKDGNTGNNVVIKDAHYNVEMDVDGDFVSIGAEIGSGAIENAALSAIGLDIKAIHYDFSLRRLHIDPMDKITLAMRDIYTLNPENNSPEAVEAAIIAPMKENAAELLRHDPEFSVDKVGFVTSDGKAILEGLVKFVGVTPEDFEVPGGLGLIPKIDADLTLEVALKLVEKVPNGAMMAGAGVSAGYLERDGDKYVCRIQFRNGELLLNGKPQPIPGLGAPGGMPGGE